MSLNEAHSRADDATCSTIADQAVIIARTLASYGRDSEAFFDRFGMRVRNQPSPMQRYPATLMADCWNRAEEECNAPDFRQRAVSHWQPDYYHLLTPTLVNAQSLCEALQAFSRYSPVISEAAKVSVDMDDERLQLTILESRTRKAAAPLDALIAYVCRLADYFSPDSPTLKRLSFTISESEVDQQMWGAMTCDIECNAATTSLYFDRDHSNRPNCNAGRLKPMEHYLACYLDALEARQKSRLQLQDQILELLGADTVTLQDLAKLLNVSCRTLQRRLKDTNTSFRQEVDAARCLKSHEYLANDSLSLSEIALCLGFADASHFSNRVRRWTGLSPLKYRRKVTSRPTTILEWSSIL